MQAVCAELESIASHDVGGRGISALVCPGSLASAAVAFLAAPSVVVLTGFPCRLEAAQPGETDGPSGAVALLAAARRLGKAAALATDDCNAAFLRAALAVRVAAAGAEVHAFPPRSAPGWEVGGEHSRRLSALAEAFVHTVAVERAGVAADGTYRTMRGRKMDALVAPLDSLMTEGCQCAAGVAGAAGVAPATPVAPARTSTGIGDGGNECGMGAVRALVEAHVPRGAEIACVTPADNLLVAGVSNWGAWALVAAVEAAVAVQQQQQQQPPLQLLPTEEEEAALERVLAEQGVGDGVSGQVEPPGSVDGLSASTHRGVLSRLRDAARRAWQLPASASATASATATATAAAAAPAGTASGPAASVPPPPAPLLLHNAALAGSLARPGSSLLISGGVIAKVSLSKGLEEEHQHQHQHQGSDISRVTSPPPIPIDLGGDIVAPGFIDLQCNGALGVDFSSPSLTREAVHRVLQWLPTTGVTAILACVITSSPAAYAHVVPLLRAVWAEEAAVRRRWRGGAAAAGGAAAGAAANAAETGVSAAGAAGAAHPPPPRAALLGLHLEGPFLSAEKRGAHAEALLAPPLTLDNVLRHCALQEADLCSSSSSSSSARVGGVALGEEEALGWWEGGGGFLKVLTLAPELPGALEVTSALAARGVAVSLGHTTADYALACTALTHGARLLTHLFNAMPPLHHRSPGPVGLLAHPPAPLAPAPAPFFSLIADGCHVHPALLALAYRAAPSRAFLITDASSLLGLPPGLYPQGLTAFAGAVVIGDAAQPAPGCSALYGGSTGSGGPYVVIEGTTVLAGALADMAQCVRNFSGALGWGGGGEEGGGGGGGGGGRRGGGAGAGAWPLGSGGSGGCAARSLADASGGAGAAWPGAPHAPRHGKFSGAGQGHPAREARVHRGRGGGHGRCAGHWAAGCARLSCSSRGPGLEGHCSRTHTHSGRWQLGGVACACIVKNC